MTVLASILLASAFSMVRGDAPAKTTAEPAGSQGYHSYYSSDSDASAGYAPSSSYGSPVPAAPDAYRLDSESPFVQQRLFNTAVALTVPLFSFQLPQRSAPNTSGVDLANQV